MNDSLLRVSVAGGPGTGKLALLKSLLPILSHEFRVSEIYEFPMTVCVDLNLKEMLPEDKQYLREVLPDWAESYSPDGILRPGRQLCTKDGRRLGNAFITRELEPIPTLVLLAVWEVVTDAGNVLKMTSEEIRELFYVGDYIAHLHTIPGLRNVAHERES